MNEPPTSPRGGFRVVPGGAEGDDNSAARPGSLQPVSGSAAPGRGETWSEFQADAWLTARDLVGWRFALDRIQRLLAELGEPQRSAPAIHVVGTNGKSSVTRMVAALLAAHGQTTGAFLSPHLAHLRERIEVAGSPVDPERHAAAVAAVARACQTIDRPGDPVTQFEAHTAAAFVAFRDAACDVLVVEAGLGGRLDATNVLDAPVVALTSIDLEHTALLGDTIAEIAAEKVAVVGAGSTLVLGTDLPEEAVVVARDHAARVGADVVTAVTEPLDRAVGAGYQQRNFALARAVCEAHAGGLDPRKVREVAAAFAMPARFETIGVEPRTILDGAHNPAGAAAFVAALREQGAGSDVVGVLSVLADKDAAGIVTELAEICDRFVLCDCGSPRALPPAELGRVVARVAPTVAVELLGDPATALATARRRAGKNGLVAICGTLALAAALRPDPDSGGDVA